MVRMTILRISRIAALIIRMWRISSFRMGIRGGHKPKPKPMGYPLGIYLRLTNYGCLEVFKGNKLSASYMEEDWAHILVKIRPRR